METPQISLNALQRAKLRGVIRTSARIHSSTEREVAEGLIAKIFPEEMQKLYEIEGRREAYQMSISTSPVVATELTKPEAAMLLTTLELVESSTGFPYEDVDWLYRVRDELRIKA